MDTLKHSPAQQSDAAADGVGIEQHAETASAKGSDSAAKTASASQAISTSAAERETRGAAAAVPFWSPELLSSLLACCLCSAALQSARGSDTTNASATQQRSEGAAHNVKPEPDEVVAGASALEQCGQSQHYACVQCGPAAGDWPAWPECLAHLVREHASCIYRCDLCQSVFLTQLLLELHFRAAHLHLVPARTHLVPFPSPSLTNSGVAERASGSRGSDVDFERSPIGAGNRKRKSCCNEKASVGASGSGDASAPKFGEINSQEQQPAELTVVRTIAESLRDKCSYCGLLCDSELALLHHQMREHRFDSSAAVGERAPDADGHSTPERTKRSSIEREPLSAPRNQKRKRSSTSATLPESVMQPLD